MAKLGRPKEQKQKTVSFRMSLREWQDLRKCAIAENASMADFLRACVKKCKRRHKNAGDWPDVIDREPEEE
jgi:hypothetical protein